MVDRLDESALKVREFCVKRGWDPFHGPKDLAIGVATEASELLQIFRFKSEAECQSMLSGPARSEIEDELADVFFFLLRFADRNGIDLPAALDKKLEANARRYPVDVSFGKNDKRKAAP
jgi:NTP pyrophosphatase (non-canonical NTP hydrolase)